MIEYAPKEDWTMTPAPVRYLIKAITLLPILICRQLSKLMPRDQNRIAIGAWYGNFYSDNPKYLTEYLLKHTNHQIFWLGNKQMSKGLPQRPNLHFVQKGTWRAYWTLLRSKFWFCCTGRGVDLTRLPLHGGAVTINLWHGTPSGKRSDHNTVWDKSSPLGKGIRGTLERAYTFIISGQRDWLTVANDSEAATLSKGFPAYFSTDKALKTGTPRYDYLIQNANNTNYIFTLKEKYAKILNFDPRRKIISYMPTWRNAGGKIFSFYNLPKTEQTDLKRLLDSQNTVLIEKHHVHTYELFPPPSDSICSIAVKSELQSQLDTQELLLISDILITDYSSIYVDFGAISRPTIHYVYELDEFTREDTGIPDNFEEIAGGPIVYDLQALKQETTRLLQNPAFEPGSKFSMLTKYETGHACENLIAFMHEASSASH